MDLEMVDLTQWLMALGYDICSSDQESVDVPAGRKRLFSAFDFKITLDSTAQTLQIRTVTLSLSAKPSPTMSAFLYRQGELQPSCNPNRWPREPEEYPFFIVNGQNLDQVYLCLTLPYGDMASLPKALECVLADLHKHTQRFREEWLHQIFYEGGYHFTPSAGNPHRRPPSPVPAVASPSPVPVRPEPMPPWQLTSKPPVPERQVVIPYTILRDASGQPVGERDIPEGPPSAERDFLLQFLETMPAEQRKTPAQEFHLQSFGNFLQSDATRLLAPKGPHEQRLFRSSHHQALYWYRPGQDLVRLFFAVEWKPTQFDAAKYPLRESSVSHLELEHRIVFALLWNWPDADKRNATLRRLLKNSDATFTDSSMPLENLLASKYFVTPPAVP